MSKIADILNQPEHLVAKFLGEVEEKNGSPSHDARFLAENVQKIRTKIAELGLDPDDTTGQELYQALLVKLEKDAAAFDEYFCTRGRSFDDKVAQALAIINNCFDKPQYWALKNSTAKNVLGLLPPKHVMKYLGYRSAESMIKREQIAEIYLATDYLESSSWHREHRRIISRLSQSSFELRSMEIRPVKYKKWFDVEGPSGFVAVNYELATIAIWPSEELKDAPLLSIALLLSDQLNIDKPDAAYDKLTSRSGILEWWADMDHLIAQLGGEHISLNISDNLLNSLNRSEYEDRRMEHGQQAFWQELLSRYDHLPPVEALFDGNIKRSISRLKFKTPQPVYEFAGDFDG